jgi:hypothetical protein
MHGKSFENFEGTNNVTIYKYIDKAIKYEQFGFDILFEEKDNREDEINEDTKYNSETYTDGTVTIRNTNFTDDAMICRSILYYWIKSGDTTFFKSRNIIEKWLIENCQFFEDKYPGELKKTNINNRIEQNNSHVVFLLERLNYLSLLESKSVESKNHLDTTEYRFTELGKLVALLLKFNENSTDLSLVKKIYDQTLNYYRPQNYSNAKFYIFFFTNCYEMDRRLFEVIIIPKLLQILKELPNDRNSIINKLRNFQVFYKNISMYIVLITSIEEFKLQFPKDYEKFAYRLKLAMESIQEKKSRNMRSFEVLRKSHINKLNSVVLEGYCNTCKNYIPVLTSMYGYLKAYVEHPDKESRSPCPNCHNEVGLNFEVLGESD